MNDFGTLPAKNSADIITDILSRLPIDSVVRCRNVCKTWRALIDDLSRRIWTTFLPADITINILSRVPADSIIQCCRCVCKTWRALVDDPFFVYAHTCQLMASSSHKGNSSFNFLLCQYRSGNCRFQFVEYNDENMSPLKLRTQPITHHPFPLNFDNWTLNFIGSCNGLVLIGSVLPNINGFFVCNPFTREYINLHHPRTTISSNSQHKGFMVYGFGCHPCSNEYKAVSIHYKSWSRSSGPGQISVYTLGSGRWRNKGEIQHQLVWNRRPGLFANGALHWMKKDDKKIVSFGLADEEFRIVPSPPPPLSPNHVDEIGVLGGCLCVTRSDKTRCESPKEIWLLNHNTSVNMIISPEESWSWTKMEFSIPWKGVSSEAEPHVILEGGKILLRDYKGLVSYSPKTESLHKDEGTFYRCCMWFDIIPYTKSFVSLKALGEEDVKSFGTVQALQQEG